MRICKVTSHAEFARPPYVCIFTFLPFSPSLCILKFCIRVTGLHPNFTLVLLLRNNIVSQMPICSQASAYTGQLAQGHLSCYFCSVSSCTTRSLKNSICSRNFSAFSSLSVLATQTFSAFLLLESQAYKSWNEETDFCLPS